MDPDTEMSVPAQTRGRSSMFDNIEAQIRDFVAKTILFNEDGFPHQDDASFLQNGVIDSLGVVELVTFTSKQFGVEVIPAEVTPENFDSVTRLAAFIRRKQRAEERCASS